MARGAVAVARERRHPAEECTTATATATTRLHDYRDALCPTASATGCAIVILYFTAFLGAVFSGNTTTWLTEPSEQLTDPAPERSAGLEVKMHDVHSTPRLKSSTRQRGW